MAAGEFDRELFREVRPPRGGPRGSVCAGVPCRRPLRLRLRRPGAVCGTVAAPVAGDRAD